jgi:hypothetical protein
MQMFAQNPILGSADYVFSFPDCYRARRSISDEINGKARGKKKLASVFEFSLPSGGCYGKFLHS